MHTERMNFSETIALALTFGNVRVSVTLNKTRNQIFEWSQNNHREN